MIGKPQDQAAVVEHAVVLVVLMRRVALIHVDVVHAVLGPELRIDARLRCGIVEVRAEREQLAAACLQIVQLTAHHVLQIVVSARALGGSAMPASSSKSGARE